MNISDGGPLPLYLSFEDAENIVSAAEFTEISKPKEMYDEVFEMKTSSYSGKVEIKCKFVPKKEVKNINLIIDGQACNKSNGSCVQVYETIPIEIIR